MEGDCYEDKKKRGRGRSRGRPRGKQKMKGLKLTRGNKIESDDDDEETPVEIPEKTVTETFTEDCDISSLQAPTFTTLFKSTPGPMKDLTWDHPVNLIGEKVLSPRIHCCDLCRKPILIYGRMIPCKHVFCLTCAKSEEKSCPRCSDKVARVEQTGLGTVFMCNFSIGDSPCKRTYLSQRDLQAHIAHRHVKSSSSAAARDDTQEGAHRDPRADYRSSAIRPDPRSVSASVCDPRVGSGGGKEAHQHHEQKQSQQQHHHHGQFHPSGRSNFSHATPTTSSVTPTSVVSHHIPVMTSSRTNLINVPLQDQQQQATDRFPSPPKMTAHPPPQMTHPPPSFSTPPPHYPASSYTGASPYSSAPPQFTYAQSPLHRPPPGAPPSFSTSLPPVPVPPPNSYGTQYAPRQWSGQAPPAPPPSHPISHPPRGPPPPHRPPPVSTAVVYYR